MSLQDDLALCRSLVDQDIGQAEALFTKIERAMAADEDDDFSKRHRFEAFVDMIAREEKVPRATAMQRARQRDPELYASYQEYGRVSKSYEALVRAEIAKGFNQTVAEQRVTE